MRPYQPLYGGTEPLPQHIGRPAPRLNAIESLAKTLTAHEDAAVQNLAQWVLMVGAPNYRQLRSILRASNAEEYRRAMDTARVDYRG